MTVALDVDGVLAFETPYKWGLETFSDFDKRIDDFNRYESFEEAVRLEKGLLVPKEKAYDWWKNPQLYDSLELNPLMKFFLDEFKKKFNNLEFLVLSDCFKEHINSKVKFCDRVLDAEKFEFYNTDKKHRYKADIYIDDKPRNLVECKIRYGNGCSTILVQHFYNNLDYEERKYIDNIILIPRNLEMKYSGVI